MMAHLRLVADCGSCSLPGYYQISRTLRGQMRNTIIEAPRLDTVPSALRFPAFHIQDWYAHARGLGLPLPFSVSWPCTADRQSGRFNDGHPIFSALQLASDEAHLMVADSNGDTS